MAVLVLNRHGSEAQREAIWTQFILFSCTEVDCCVPDYYRARHTPSN